MFCSTGVYLYVGECKTPALLWYIAIKSFGQQWLFEKVEESSTNDMETDIDSTAAMKK